ncbi:N2227-domain-containing protein [Wolfiporia cocos MD-104 SS10]|uniref:N2227-domain-containing protein n=1 Tax=Wolfiporia cocos (strain MD-104) TaxID=742152 RepID=A0A2H3J2W5_WOLCO|nr:N2227-domain-containing protein [Wolfiporia cocos MD-104 SS10]
MFSHFLSSDTFLACLLPLTLFLLSLRLVGNSTLPELRQLLRELLYGVRRTTSGHFSVERATLSYEQYANLSNRELDSMRSSYARLGRAHKRIGYELGYPRKLDRLQDAIRTNAKVTQGIVELARHDFPDHLRDLDCSGTRGDLGRVRESLKHFVRDWSEEGREERGRIFSPILDMLKEVPQAKRDSLRVLVPGSGLGRLAWEISLLGFNVTANELSYFMNLAFRFLLSEKTTQSTNQHTLQPYASWFSHQRTDDALFRHIAFPDVVPRLTSTLHLAEGDFLAQGPPASFDYIVTLFFLDTSLNAIETVEHVHSLLKSGGTWINLGPLLWTAGGQATVELSLEEVLHLVRLTGFRFRGDECGVASRTVQCEYTADKQAMMQWLYHAEFWVADK